MTGRSAWAIAGVTGRIRRLPFPGRERAGIATGRAAGMAALLLLLVLGIGSSAGGCVCTLVGCFSAVSVTLVTATFQGRFPVTVTACAGSSCSSVWIDHSGHGST